MHTCFSSLTGLSWEGAAADLLASGTVSAYLAVLAIIGFLSGRRFLGNAAFYVPVLTIVSSLLLLLLMVYRMEAQFLISGHVCIGDKIGPDGWMPPRELFWKSEILKVALTSIGAVLIPFGIGWALGARHRNKRSHAPNQ